MGKYHVFVGGPLDQRFVSVPDGREFFECIERKPMPLFPLTGVMEEESLTRVCYKPHRVHGVTVWAPSDMRPPQIIELLLARYGYGEEKQEGQTNEAQLFARAR